MSPLVAAGGGDIFSTDADLPAASVPAAPPGRSPWGALDYASCGVAAGAAFHKAGNPGPKTPAQISQYAASPIRYGQPPETVACPLG
jgi:hypothetical protein